MPAIGLMPTGVELHSENILELKYAKESKTSSSTKHTATSGRTEKKML